MIRPIHSEVLGTSVAVGYSLTGMKLEPAQAKLRANRVSSIQLALLGKAEENLICSMKISSSRSPDYMKLEANHNKCYS